MAISKEDLILNIQNTMRSVEVARNSCSHAGFAETADLFSKNKWVSVWSSSSNFSMRNDLERMKKQLNELQRDLTDFQTANIHAPNDLLDLATDYFSDWNVDWLSWLNLSRTHDIKRQCDTIYRKLGEVLAKLQNTSFR